MTLITSTANQRIRKVRELLTSRGRKQQGLFLMEGPHLLETLLDAAIVPVEVFYQPELLSRTVEGRALLRRLLSTPSLPVDQVVEVSERVIEALGETETSQGVVSVLPLDAFAPERTRQRRSPAERPALLILDALSDPGNMGTILRTSLAADVEAVLLTPNCVDSSSPKVVRSAAGAHVALPIAANQSWPAIMGQIEEHSHGQPRIYLAEAGRTNWYFEQDLRAPFALIIGNEARGPSQQARSIATNTVSIPLSNGVESLNAAMAAGIILYEAVRQKYHSL